MTQAHSQRQLKQIELHVRFYYALCLRLLLKHHMKIKAFVGTSINAVLTQIWIAIITYLLLAFSRHSAKAGWTVRHIMLVIQLSLFERRSLKSILIPDQPNHKKASLK